MANSVEAAKIEWYEDAHGRKAATVTFRVAWGDEIPGPDDFSVPITVWDQGTADLTIDVAKRYFHRLTRNLAQATENWNE